MKRIFPVLLLALSMVFGQIHAQQLVLNTYDRSSGLASDYVLCMLQDRDGFIWCGTDRGVSRFDGESFTTYTTREGLPDNFVTTMFQDNNGYLWFGTYEAGVARFDGKSFFTYSTKQGLAGNSVKVIAQDKFDRMYFLTEVGLSVLYQNIFSSLPLKNNIIQMLVHDGKEIVIYVGKNIYRILPTNDTTIQYQQRSDSLLKGSLKVRVLNSSLNKRFNADLLIGYSSSFQLAKFHNDTSFQTVRKYRTGNIAAIVDGLDSTLWCGTLADGIAEVNENNITWYDTRHGLAQKRVEAMIRDYEGNIWISTFGSGVQKLSGSYVRFYQQTDGLPDNHVFTIYEDSKKRLWFGTAKGLSVLENGAMRTFSIPDKNWKEIRSIVEDERGNYYIGTFEYLFGPISFEKLLLGETMEKGRIGYGVAALALTPPHERINSADMWIATYGDGVIHKLGMDTTNYGVEDGVASKIIEDIVSSPGSLWFLSRNAGATQLQGDSFKTYSMKDGLQSNTIFSLYQEPKTSHASTKSVVWFGTDVGLIRFEDGQSKLFVEKDGLRGTPVMGIFSKEDGGGKKLFIVTPKGLHQYEKTLIRLIQTFPFLSSGNISINDVHYSPSSNLLWIATPNGVYSLSVEERTQKIIPPKVLVTKAFADTSLIYEFLPARNVQQEVIELEYFQNNVMMEYAALSFISESEVQYRFRLEPLEKTWSLLTKDRHVQYRNLNHGEYRFVVEAINGDGVSSEHTAQIQFAIAVPYWERWWFLSLSGFAFSGLLIGAIIYISQRNLKRRLLELERQHAVQNERERISRDLHDNVGAQIVSIISGLELAGRYSETKKEDIANVLDSLKGDARSTMTMLRETIWALQSSEMTVENLARELEQYIRNQLKYHPNIVLKFLIDGETNAGLRPVEAINILRIAQEALSNCLKHATPSTIDIQLVVDTQRVFRLKFCNNGCSKEHEQEFSGGKGLPNMERRAKEIGGTFQFIRENEQLACVEVQVPLK